jgi:hypothetical protein
VLQRHNNVVISRFHSIHRTSGRGTFQSQSTHTHSHTHTDRESLLTVHGDQVVYQKYKWSKDPSLRSKCADIPNSFVHFLKNLANAFGWKFVIMVSVSCV